MTKDGETGERWEKRYNEKRREWEVWNPTGNPWQVATVYSEAYADRILANHEAAQRVGKLEAVLAPLRFIHDEDLKALYRRRFADRDDYDYGDDEVWWAQVRTALLTEVKE